MQPLDPIAPAAVRAARRRVQGLAVRTPLIRLNKEKAPAEIFLKLENLQPIGSFKIRGAASALTNVAAADLARGVYTASAGNMAQGLAYAARRRGIACSVVVPEHAPETKLAAIHRLGAAVIKVPFDEWWRIILTHRFEGLDGLFIHPVSHPDVIAGNGTIGLEILEDLPDVDTVLVPYGGGGLSCGIATALRDTHPHVPVYACEVETAAPLAASLAAGKPVEIQHTPSFVDGIGGRSVLAEMWPLARHLLAGSLVVSLPEVAAAIRHLLERNRVLAEGAGAAPVAAALAGQAEGRKIVCVVSGGNLDISHLCTILAGKVP
ncbi:MAG: threonine/serine dehydratase [Acidobacteriota bacterium]